MLTSAAHRAYWMFQRRRSAVALRHVAFEDLGLLAPIMEREGWNVSFCEAPVDDLHHSSIGDADLLIVLGGPIGVYEAESYPFITREIDLLERRLAQGLPTLGICLGAQLMAKALGARVYAGPIKEIGWGSVALSEAGLTSSLNPLTEGTPVLHWHGDTFDLPDNAIRLASNENYENQAFALGAMRLRSSFTWRPIRGSSRSGMSAMPSSSRAPGFRYGSFGRRPRRSRRCSRDRPIASFPTGSASSGKAMPQPGLHKQGEERWRIIP
ncbi:glutamine amidotransferase-related protein [Bradyrhizobium neotropicale]|uniref:glutamine amidotransferase-related protein n=1 Tax=Bradyrhizobium neotropicale TaxID=1497615 RepID=UPI000A842F76|nr:gamma-glutamyl-gamma-aminobutyrate hydrolase family protein [Bradyrhizobium neotropicale]